MVDRYQEVLLRRGVRQWNTWRDEHPEMKCDLRNADLHRANLQGANLRNADLHRANLSEAYLTEANLSEAYLTEANLHSADFTGADLRAANFVGADLTRANLREANLTRAKLFKANLSGAYLSRANATRAIFSNADLTNADLREATFQGADLTYVNLTGAFLTGANLSLAAFELTILIDLDLRGVKGLETIRHRGPSGISIDTLFRSRGQIPESFLRKAGVPEDFLTYLPSLLNRAIEYYTCFISYASQNEDFAQRLYADLQAKGVRCWFAPEDMKIGDKIRQRIDETIRLYDKLLLILSEQSVASEWVEFEVEAALSKERREKHPVLFPIRLDSTVMDSTTAWASHIKDTRHIGNFSQWKDHDAYQSALKRLLRDLQPEQLPKNHTS